MGGGVAAKKSEELNFDVRNILTGVTYSAQLGMDGLRYCCIQNWVLSFATLSQLGWDKRSRYNNQNSYCTIQRLTCTLRAVEGKKKE
jgi:hypothetical protein